MFIKGLSASPTPERVKIRKRVSLKLGSPLWCVPKGEILEESVSPNQNVGMGGSQGNPQFLGFFGQGPPRPNGPLGAQKHSNELFWGFQGEGNCVENPEMSWFLNFPVRKLLPQPLGNFWCKWPSYSQIRLTEPNPNFRARFFLLNLDGDLLSLPGEPKLGGAVSTTCLFGVKPRVQPKGNKKCPPKFPENKGPNPNMEESFAKGNGIQ